MSDELRSAILQGERDPALRVTERLVAAGRAASFVSTVLDLLEEESAWIREEVLALLHRAPVNDDVLGYLFEALGSERLAERRNAARSALSALASPEATQPDMPLEQLVERLQHDGDVDIRILCANALGESHNPRARLALEAALRDPEANVVAAAAEALGELNDPRAVDALIELARQGDFWTGSAAIVSLGQLGGARAVPVLARLTDDRWLAIEAARALESIGDAAALPALRKMLARSQDQRREAMHAAAGIVSRIGISPPEWLREVVRIEEARLVEDFARDGTLEQARLLGISGSLAATNALIEQLQVDPDGVATVGLEMIPPEVRTEAILHRLDQASEDELAPLLILLPRLQSRRAIEAVGELLVHPDGEVKAAAADVLGRADTAVALEVLESLRSRPEARLGVALAYGRLGSSRCTPLVQMLRDPDPAVRAAAAEGTGRCDLATVPELSAILRDETDPTAARALVRALGQIGGDEAVSVIAGVLDSGDAALRFDAVRALGCTGTTAAYSHLIEALADDDPGIRTIALSALGELGDARAAEPLSRHIDDPDRDRRRLAADSISRLHGGDWERTLVDKALHDPDREVRLVAVGALGRLRLPGTLTALEQVAERDQDALVRHTAASLVAALHEPARGEPS